MLRTLLGLIMSRATWVAQRITTSNKLVIFLMRTGQICLTIAGQMTRCQKD